MNIVYSFVTAREKERDLIAKGSNKIKGFEKEEAYIEIPLLENEREMER